MWGFKIDEIMSLGREEDCIVCVPRFVDEFLPAKFSREVGGSGMGRSSYFCEMRVRR